MYENETNQLVFTNIIESYTVRRSQKVFDIVDATYQQQQMIFQIQIVFTQLLISNKELI